MRNSFLRKAVISAIAIHAPLAVAGVTISATNSGSAYQQIENKLNSVIEAPDCAHPEFGPHITLENDSALNKPVFVFHAHVKPDNDRCLKSDRQRNEIKVDAKSPAELRTVKGESMTYRWRFKLDSGFLTSPDFTHLHQIKPVGGDDDNPLVTLIARGSNMELTHYNYSNSRKVLKTVPLDSFRGEWVEVTSTLTAGRPGKYSMSIKRIRDGATLLSYSTTSIDMWRSGNSYLRPKWGIYRSLNRSSYLRDEKVRFDGFCIAKGSDSTCNGSTPTTTTNPTTTSPTTSTPSVAKLSVPASAVTASANDGNAPANTVDSSLSTRWSANGDGQWIRYDLGEVKTVSYAKLAWHNGSSRTSRFEIQVSADGSAFTTVLSGQSSGTTTGRETYDFTDVSARYVRVLGHGNSSNSWNSITEAEIYGM